MAEKTVTRADLSEAVYQEVGLSRNESADLVESVLAEISDTLTRGETVKISSFGSFSVRQKGQRIGRNPKTGEEVPILPRRVLVFRASNVLKSRINGQDVSSMTDDLDEDDPADRPSGTGGVQASAFGARGPYGTGS
jgi:integration host factor subunit alpha